MALSLMSTAFTHEGEIPTRYTCDGADVSPQLSWAWVPDGTRSLVLIVDDPDAPDPRAPQRTWVHWVLYDLDPEAPELPEGVAENDLPAGTRQGLNDWKRTGYGGPCPPIGRHRYFFKLYALDTRLPDMELPRKGDLEAAMEGHVLEYAELIGTYQKKGAGRR
jgi:Raf kinase inhibitor-like YbhB/YbcL family protein